MMLLVMVLSAASAWAWTGSGTSDVPYQIANKTDLETLRNNVNNGTDYENTYFVQTTDITLSGAWTPIGADASHPFKGRYDGGGYTISGLTVTITSGQYAGLFGYVKGGEYQGSEANTHLGEVHDVVLQNPAITVTANSSDQYAGAVVGYAGNCAQVYDNTVIGGSVTFTGGSNYNTNNSYAGGLIGYYGNSNLPKLSGNKVSGTTVGGGGVCGGLVGYHSSTSTQLSGNFADADVSSVEFDLHTYQHTYGYRQGALAGYCYMTGGGITSVNYYHSRNGLTAYGNNPEHPAFIPVADNAWVSTLYIVAAPSGLTVSGTPTVSLNGTDYYAADATVTLSTDADHIISGTPTVSGTGATLGTVATNRKSMTVTIGTADATVSATLVALSGSCGDNATWTMTDEDGNGTYETLSISGTGAITSSPWATDFAATIERVNIGSADLSISGNPFSTLGEGAVIVVPTPAYAVSYSSAAYASKLRVALGSYLFTATNEGGAAAYEIKDWYDLKHLDYYLNSGAQMNCSGMTFRQTADINDLGNLYIGAYDYFEGTYDGGGYTLSGLNVDVTGKGIWYLGFFKKINNATVKNIRLVSPRVIGNLDGSLGALIGYAGHSNIDNCVVINPTVSGHEAAAIVGNLYQSQLTNCYLYDSNTEHNYDLVYKESSSTSTNLARARKVTLDDNVTMSPADASDPVNGFVYNNESYYREGLQLTLSSIVPDGYTTVYSANGTAFDGTTYTVNSTDGDVTLTAASAPDFATHWHADENHDGSTAEKAYIISTTTGLNLLASQVNSGIDYSGKYFQLDNDITYSYVGLGETESNYTAIGGDHAGDKYFKGHFDGQNHVVSGIRIYKGGTDNADLCQGLFGKIGSPAEVKNVILADATITGFNCTAGIVGHSSSGGSIENCHVAADVTIRTVQKDAGYHGGIVGLNYGTVRHCTSAATLTFSGIYNCQFYGGIAGQNNATMTDNLAIGVTVPTIDNNKSHGAIAGSNNNGTLARNYYTACTVAGVANVIGKGCKNADVTNDDGAVPSLRDNADNSTFLALMTARNTALTAVEHTTPLSTAVDVALNDRTLYKDGDWNTLCLPFDVSTTSGPLAGDDVVAMTLNTQSSGLSGTTLTLNFDNASATIPAGTPFIIKWATKDAPATDLVSPVFTGVTIDNTDRSVTSDDGYVTFMGTYSKQTFTDVANSKTEDKSILFVGADNTLHYPISNGNNDYVLNACRAYFQLNNGLTAEYVSTARMNFDDGEATGIISVNGSGLTVNGSDAWYTLNGVKLSGKPTKSGLYIHGNRKVVIK